MNIYSFSKSYDGALVLDFPGLEVEPGKIYGIIGANGSGKSTFAKVLAGVIPGDQRGPHWDGESLGYLPQKPYPFRMTTKKNLLLNGDEEERARELMEVLQITHLERKIASKLSGGETARMALARLMMKDYDLVILDEPTAAMDMESTVLAERLMASYVRQTNCALLLITHSLPQAKRLADEVLFFRQGKLREQGAKKQILQSPTQPETKAFLEFYD